MTKIDDCFSKTITAAMADPEVVENAIIILIGPGGVSAGGATMSPQDQVRILTEYIQQLETRESELVYVHRKTGEMLTEKPGKAN